MAVDEGLGYILPVIETAGDLADARARYGLEVSVRWYLEARTASMIAAGVWDPLKHPRGKDGKFIEVGKWVKFLWQDGHWHRGKVSALNYTPDGKVSIAGQDMEGFQLVYPKNIYTLPQPKALLPLPDVTKGESDNEMFHQVGGQGGSNPGGLFEVKEGVGAGDLNTKTDDIDSLPTVDPAEFTPAITGKVHLVQTDSGTHAVEIQNEEGAPGIDTPILVGDNSEKYTFGQQMAQAIKSGAGVQAGIQVKVDEVSIPGHPLLFIRFYDVSGNKGDFIDATLDIGLDDSDGGIPSMGYYVKPFSGGSQYSSDDRGKLKVMMEQVFPAQGAAKGLQWQEGHDEKALFSNPPQPGRPVVVDLVSGQKVHTSSLAGMPVVKAKLDDAAEKAIAAAKPSGSVLEGVSPGDKFYIKKQKDSDHAHNEILANRLYELAGVPVPDTYLGTDGLTFGSKILTGDVHPLLEATDDELTEFRKGFIIDAWLANWDVVGLDYDNTVLANGVPYRIDAGGAMLYRAQGSAKGPMWTDEVGEIDSMVNTSINPQAAKVFGGMTNGDIYDGLVRLQAISPEEIKDACADAGFMPSMADRLIARRQYILDHYADDLLNPAVMTPPDQEEANKDLEKLLAEEEKIEKATAAFDAGKKIVTSSDIKPGDTVRLQNDGWGLVYIGEETTDDIYGVVESVEGPDIDGDYQVYLTEPEKVPNGWSWAITGNDAVGGVHKYEVTPGSLPPEAKPPVEVEKYPWGAPSVGDSVFYWTPTGFSIQGKVDIKGVAGSDAWQIKNDDTGEIWDNVVATEDHPLYLIGKPPSGASWSNAEDIEAGQRIFIFDGAIHNDGAEPTHELDDGEVWSEGGEKIGWHLHFHPIGGGSDEYIDMKNFPAICRVAEGLEAYSEAIGISSDQEPGALASRGHGSYQHARWQHDHGDLSPSECCCPPCRPGFD